MKDKLAVVDGAVIVCAAGSAPSLLVINNGALQIDYRMVAAIQDHRPGYNIRPFGICAFTNKPCVPVTPAPWFPGETTLLGGMFPLLDDASILGCTVGGIIAVQHPGEVFVRVGDERLQFEGDEQGPGLLLSLVPIVGPAAAAGFASGQGRKGAMWAHLGLAVFDAATLGSGALLRGGVTAAVKGGARGMGSLFARRMAAARAARATALAGRIFGKAADGSRWARHMAGRSPQQMFQAASSLAARFRRAAARNDGSFQRLRRAFRDERGSAEIGPRGRGGRGPVWTGKEARQKAEEMGYKPTGELTKKGKQPIYKHKKRRVYIARDRDGHHGGAWKVADSPDKLNSKTTRRGTYDKNLEERLAD